MCLPASFVCKVNHCRDPVPSLLHVWTTVLRAVTSVTTLVPFHATWWQTFLWPLTKSQMLAPLFNWRFHPISPPASLAVVSGLGSSHLYILSIFGRELRMTAYAQSQAGKRGSSQLPPIRKAGSARMLEVQELKGTCTNTEGRVLPRVWSGHNRDQVFVINRGTNSNETNMLCLYLWEITLLVSVHNDEKTHSPCH